MPAYNGPLSPNYLAQSDINDLINWGMPKRQIASEPAAPQQSLPTTNTTPFSGIQSPVDTLGLDTARVMMAMGNSGPALLDPATAQKVKADFLKSIEDQKSGIGDAQNILKQYQEKPQQIDLSPLLAWADSTYGGTAAKGYKSPDTAEDRAAKAATLQNYISNQQAKLTGDLSDLMRFNNQTQSSNAIARMIQGERGRQVGMEKYMMDNVNKGIVDKVADDKARFGQMEQSFARNDYQSVMSALGPYARGVGQEKGVLTDTDLSRNLPRSFAGDWAKFESYFNNTPSSEINPEYVKNLMELTKIAKVRAAEKYGKALEARAKSYSAGAFAPLMNKGQVGDVLIENARKDINDLAGPQEVTAPTTSNGMSNKDKLAKLLGQ